MQHGTVRRKAVTVARPICSAVALFSHATPDQKKEVPNSLLL